jgi:catechol 2,3-dioxygenase-like lactoylglutathione lyase family enzyme
MSDRVDERATIEFEGVTPIFRVKSVPISLEYYTHQLGFKIDWQTPGFASVSRGRCCLFLSEGDQGHAGGWVWVGVSDPDALLDEYRRTGAKVRHPPTNYPWAYEMQVEDPDGNVLRFGSDTKSNEPVGEWLDMQGNRWVQSSENKWTRGGPV